MTIDLDTLRHLLPEREIHWHEELPTTMTEASRLAALGAPSGTVVGADFQTAGRGRFGRGWHSEHSAGLYVTVILRPRFDVESFPALTLAMGLATSEAILAAAGIHCDLRWPNDVLIGEHKCAGILVTAEVGAILAGIGVNVNQTSFPDDLGRAATSLRLATGMEHSREGLMIHLLPAIDGWLERIAAEGARTAIETFQAISSYARNRRVALDTGETGATAGLDPQGYLWLRRDNGEVIKVLAGGVRPA